MAKVRRRDVAAAMDGDASFYQWLLLTWRRRTFVRTSLLFLFPKKQLLRMPWPEWLGWFYHVSSRSQFKDRSTQAEQLKLWAPRVKRDSKPLVEVVPDGPLEFVRFIKVHMHHRGRCLWSAPLCLLQGDSTAKGAMVSDDLAIAVESFCTVLVSRLPDLGGVRSHVFFEVTSAFPERSHIVLGSHILRSSTSVLATMYTRAYVDHHGNAEVDATSATTSTIDLLSFASESAMQQLVCWGQKEVKLSRLELGPQGLQALRSVLQHTLAPALGEELDGSLTLEGMDDIEERLQDFLHVLLQRGALATTGDSVSLVPGCDIDYRQELAHWWLEQQ